MRRVICFNHLFIFLAAVFGFIIACTLVLHFQEKVVPKATLIIVDKTSLTMQVLSGNKIIARFPVAVGKMQGQKRLQGDWRTPEGRFYITDVQYPPKDAILWLSYPNAEAAEWGLMNHIVTQKEHDEIMAALRKKIIPLQGTGLGGGIAIHADKLKNGRWTPGCVVLRNLDMFLLVWLVPPGTPVIIKGDSQRGNRKSLNAKTENMV